MTMREKIADALQRMDCGGQATWLDLADAALSTLETPDEGMVEAGAKVFGSHFAGAKTARTTFVAMIRHARKGGE